MLEAGKMCKDLSDFDKGQIAMARRLGQSISKTPAYVGCSRSAVALSIKSGQRKKKRWTGDRYQIPKPLNTTSVKTMILTERSLLYVPQILSLHIYDSTHLPLSNPVTCVAMQKKNCFKFSTLPKTLHDSKNADDRWWFYTSLILPLLCFTAHHILEFENQSEFSDVFSGYISG